MPMIREFVVFLRKYGVLGLIVAVLMGDQINNIEKALIDDVLMQLISPILPTGEWQSAVLQVGRARLKIGHLLEAILHFFFVALTVFLVLKYALREKMDEPESKP